jgi:hypothetical protein
MKALLSALTAASLSLGGLAGCKEEGPAEKAGKKIDEAIEEGGNGAGEASEEARQIIDDVGDRAQEELKEKDQK